MLYCKFENPHGIGQSDLKKVLSETFDKIGNRKKILIIPPDITRYHSQAGIITSMAYSYYRDRITDILPATGTHNPMKKNEIDEMFVNVPQNLFRSHDWRHDLITLGRVPSEFVNKVSENKLEYDWPAQVNKLLVQGKYDMILSIGQVVPHEVVGMANYNKNIFVGTGGSEGINKSHFLGAVYGMERIMGRKDTPVRKVLNYASEKFATKLPIIYIHTVIGKNKTGKLSILGLYIGDDEDCFNEASKLSLKYNFILMDKPLKKVVVYLSPSEYRSTWLGNKAIYRTRMVIDDGGELIILAPGVKEFGEDKQIDCLIRKYGYGGTEKVLTDTKNNDDLQKNMSAAAHLIHGSSEERFSITYCPGNLLKEEIESVNFNYADLNKMVKKYNPERLSDGLNYIDGEEIFYISNPALGLWSVEERFKNY